MGDSSKFIHTLEDQKRPQCYITLQYQTEDAMKAAASQFQGAYLRFRKEIRGPSALQIVDVTAPFWKDEVEALGASRAFKKRTREQELAIAERDKQKAQFQAVQVDDFLNKEI